MKVLYASDLDGTLFNRKKELTDYTAGVLNRLIKNGGLFSIATARMSYGCDYKLEKVNFNIPVIVMNGACLYSLHQKKYVDVKAINFEKVKLIKQILDGFECNAYMYTYKDNSLSIHYKQDTLEISSQYLSERALQACSEIIKAESLSSFDSTGQIIYFALTGSEQLIRQIDDEIKQVSGIGSSMYLNIYNGLFCLEIFDESANKANALLKLKNMVCADKLIVFGDNHNDLGMMKIADESYAPKDALEEVLLAATDIIESCDEDGVARFLEQSLKL